MPINKCGKSKKGYKWGNSGKCYSSKSKARKQGVAIILSKKRRGKK